MNFSMEMEVTGVGAVEALINRLDSILDHPLFREALVDGSSIIEEKAKENLLTMVYEKPEGWYRRTRNLFNGTQITGRVIDGINEITTGVHSNVEYAVWVHEGTGIFALNGQGRKTPWFYKDSFGVFHRTVGQHPNPYLTKAIGDGKSDVLTLLHNAVIRIGGSNA